MAAISSSFGNTNINNNSEATSTSLKAPAFEADEGSEDTSSSGSSSESSTGDDEPGYINERGSPSGHSSSPSSSADSDDSDSDESDSDDSDLDESDSDDSDNSSEWTDSVMANDVRFTSFSTNESDMSDSDRSSDKEEPSGFSEFSDNVFESEHREIDSTSAAVQSCSSSSKVRKENLRPIPAPPGAGKERTKRRNARRRAAKLAKKLQGPDLNNPNATTIKRIPDGDGDPGGNNNKSALFEAKRKALLDAIATGGIEICPSGETTFDHGFGEAAREKRKHINEGGADRLHDKNEAIGEIAKTSPGDSEESAGHKRRRVDLGAGRRLVFGALGVRAPKNKEDEDELRDQLQANAQPHIDRQDSSHAQPTLGEALCARDEQGTDVWKLKINYRAVECCEDNTKLGPAPFPFQQRWDPQQQYSSTPKKKQRGGQSKRAQRNQNQYYNSNPLDRKRKRCYSHGSVDGSCDRREDTVDGFDVTLNYDDIDNQSRDRNETSQTTDLDDLPSLPKDVSELPSLRPGEARPGMVITWLKWRCSSATGWQPQLSRVAAIVARVDDSGTMLRVCLAKRDRLDEDEKRYDPKTGQRIYDRFEAPELREEDEADDHDNIGMDEGYRDVPWAEMQDPKILQQPLDPTIELVPNSKCISSVEMHDKTANRNADRAGPIADLPNIYSVTSLTRPNDHEPMHTLSKGNIPVGEAPESTGSPKERPGESSIESRVEVASNAMSQRTRQKQQTTDLAVSDTSQISSPSRQLLETTSQAMVSNSPTRNWAPASSVELGESPRADTSSCVPVPISVSSQSRLEEDCGSDIISGTPKAVFDQEATPSSASSAQSGRQLDYDMNIGDQIPGPFDATDDIGRQSYGLEQNTSPSARRSLTPTANRQTVTHDHENKQPLDGVIGSSPLARSTSGSLSSLSPLWCTALTSHSTQNSSGALELSITPKPNVSSSSRDATYEAAMRKLDTQFSDASSPPPADDGLEVKREDPTQFQAETREAISPPPRRRCFTIPEGTQIVELSSDSEPTYTENYADDAIDGTYSPRSDSLPRGDGWVTKRRDAIRRKARKSVV
ncbi:hypothetical protein F5Y01DRAFT_70472 [Xylaria sp. FL0043]|nr:hypothetical protein F5Y01DRAFT_70472 [Xylaria sp. FL0043]